MSTHQEVNKLLINPSSSASNQGNKAEEEESQDKALTKSERKTLKNRIGILEDIVREKENENVQLRTELDAARSLVKREREINDVYTKWGINPKHLPTTQPNPAGEVTEVACKTTDVGPDICKSSVATDTETESGCTDHSEGDETPLCLPKPAVVVTPSVDNVHGHPVAVNRDAPSPGCSVTNSNTAKSPDETGSHELTMSGRNGMMDQSVNKDKRESILPKRKS